MQFKTILEAIIIKAAFVKSVREPQFIWLFFNFYFRFLTWVWHWRTSLVFALLGWFWAPNNKITLTAFAHCLFVHISIYINNWGCLKLGLPQELIAKLSLNSTQLKLSLRIEWILQRLQQINFKTYKGIFTSSKSPFLHGLVRPSVCPPVQISCVTS